MAKWTLDEAIQEVMFDIPRYQGKARAFAGDQPARLLIPIATPDFDHRAYANDVADAIAALPYVESAEWTWMLGDAAPSPQLKASGHDRRPGFVVVLKPEGVR